MYSATLVGTYQQGSQVIPGTLDNIEMNPVEPLDLEEFVEDRSQEVRSPVLEAPRNDHAPGARSSRKNTKAAIRVATLNIRGYRQSGAPMSETKWHHINQLMRDKKIGILVVQESHLNEERKTNIESLFGKRLRVFYTADPTNPTGKGGVAIVLNRDLTNTENVLVKEIVPGRALMISTNWHRDKKLNILGIYAPNVTQGDGEANRAFWKNLDDFFKVNPQVKIDVMAGDMNVVEDEINRLPMRSDPEDATEALDNLKNQLGI